jgi:predicted metallo-beta-lactamase superfamily hydrolase
MLLKKIKVIPIAEESLGVRSMCTYVETSDVKILLDAGASLAPKRLGYPPHTFEYQALAESRKRISETAEKAEIITISHYHFDHHTPSYTDWFTNWSSAEAAKKIYENKIVLAKSYRSMVNPSQRRRGWMFKKTAGIYSKKLEIADSSSFTFGDTKIHFSDPVFHGTEDSDLGWVLMTTIERENEKVLFTSDIQGPIQVSTLNKILVQQPQLVIVGGPPTYLAGLRVNEEDIEQGMQNLKWLVENIPLTILEHHPFRDENWEILFQPIFDSAKDAGNKMLTAAEFIGQKNIFLEFRRKELFETDPPSIEFKKWIKLSVHERKRTKPPV